jgi:DNA-binding beta-propeller fold protein YncE
MVPTLLLAAVLVVSTAERTATLVDTGTLRPIARFPTGVGPHEVTVSHDQRYAYIADAGGRTITVVDLARREVAATWDTGEGSQPHDLRASRDGAVVWAACAPLKAVLEIDADDGTIVRTFATGKEGGWMLAAAPDDARLYVAHLEGGGISIIERKTGTVRYVPTARGEMALDVSPDGRQAWAANLETGQISVIDARRGEVAATLSSGGKAPIRLKLTSDGKRAVVVHREPQVLVVLDVARRAPVATVPLPHPPKILALSPDGARAFITGPASATLTRVDLRAGRVLDVTPTAKTPDGIAWVGEPGPFPGQVAFTIPQPDLVPEGIAHDPVTGTFFVSSTYRRKILAVTRDGAVRDFTTEGQDGLLGVVGMHVDAKRRRLWAAASDAGEHMPIKGGTPGGRGVGGLYSYDLATGKLDRKLILDERPGAQHFLNDLAIAAGGDVYVTDSMAGTVYVLRVGGDALAPLAPAGALPFANGIVLSGDERTLFVSTRDGLVSFDVASRRVTPLGAGRADGLALHRGRLIAVQPWERGKVIVRHALDGTRVVRSDVIVPDHPEHLQPTTGVVVGNAFYYIANSQLQHFRALVRPDGTFPLEPLRPPVILRVDL